MREYIVGNIQTFFGVAYRGSVGVGKYVNSWAIFNDINIIQWHIPFQLVLCFGVNNHVHSAIFFAKTIISLHCFLVGTSAEYMTAATKHLSSNPKLMCHRILSSQRPRRLLDLKIFSTTYILGTN